MTVVLKLEDAVANRLASVSDRDGISQDQLASEAIDVWTRLDPERRQVLGFYAMKLIIGAAMEGKH